MKKTLLIFLFIIIMLFCCSCASLPFLALMAAPKEITTTISDYEEYIEKHGKETETFEIVNDHFQDILPPNIPDSAKVEDFYYNYYNPWDPNYVAYLVYTCSDEDYAKEIERLSQLDSSQDYLIYDATGFNYPVCAVFADYHGYLYALADKANNRLIYVEINFCNFFCDIDYETIIPKDYLPINFDATHGNSTRQAFDNGEILLN